MVARPMVCRGCQVVEIERKRLAKADVQLSGTYITLQRPEPRALAPADGGE